MNIVLHFGEMRWKTTQETYGSFWENWSRTFLPQLPKAVKNRESVPHNNPKTSDNYGSFYTTKSDDEEIQEGITNVRFPPLIAGTKTGSNEPSYQQPPLDLKLPNLETVQLEFRMKDSSVVNFSDCHSVRNNTVDERIHLPDIKEIVLKLKDSQGTSVCVHSVPHHLKK